MSGRKYIKMQNVIIQVSEIEVFFPLFYYFHPLIFLQLTILFHNYIFKNYYKIVQV